MDRVLREYSRMSQRITFHYQSRYASLPASHHTHYQHLRLSWTDVPNPTFHFVAHTMSANLPRSVPPSSVIFVSELICRLFSPLSLFSCIKGHERALFSSHTFSSFVSV
ncbi:hypothetical protein AUEXF2481DRAFT_504709 [Aureobasidium subglaciale EXF-2481]|uniref:Uncharacterized protein n=1 Tax=Aureobasidium subglaciale (strain EXF-2481) TaxID=1043005 RepID=A0A074YWI4_AURSE|nr:uncharacterized protein AUEXF2481DRAFT_504709 [Aureobasidium subglaciale EXF-2481]KEQ91221.1 hypothetical protein AUEXF2481DRAFT_504709 [Aureobasidium subglaciale EXF-2481]